MGRTDENFASLMAIICRPGVGILTDCVRFAKPALVVNDGYNKEINHNASRVNELGIGRSFNSREMSISELAGSLARLLTDEAALKEFTATIKGLETGGARKAADYLLKKANQNG